VSVQTRKVSRRQSDKNKRIYLFMADTNLEFVLFPLEFDRLELTCNRPSSPDVSTFMSQPAINGDDRYSLP